MLLKRNAARIAAFILAAGVLAMAGAGSAEDDGEKARAEGLLRGGRYQEAATLFEELSRLHPEDGTLWANLGLANAYLGNHEAAIAANLRAAEFPAVRPGSLYNLACSYAVLGRTDQAAETLDQAQAAGFLDFDLMKADPDLETLRKGNRIGFPPALSYESLRARNRVDVGYRVVLPRNYDASRTYPALVSFGLGSGVASADWMTANVWGESSAERGWIAVHLVAPKDGWINHPSHHALEELLTNLRNEYSIEGDRFHLVGFLNGSRAATTYGGMSAPFFHSLTTVNSRAFDRWDEDEVSDYPTRVLHLLVSSQDAQGVAAASHARDLLTKGGRDVRVTVLEDQGPVPASLLDGGLMRYLDERVRVPSAN
ncbi:MAG: hypothetical protein DHS20C21_08850 [Gemmatimonadota bacterium]|nr:MAG: hypothetical protein DHS20C21_08850 [Gemmatimonadota bacterium]